MHRKRHNFSLLLLLAVMLCVGQLVYHMREVPELVKYLVSSLTLGGAALCVIEMADYFMFGED